jgi:hypothetical protein
MSGSLFKRSRATMLVAAGAMALSTVSAGGAQAVTAAQKCTIKGYTPGKFTVAATDTERQFRIKTSGCTQKNWRVDLLLEDGAVDIATKAKPVTQFVPSKMINSMAGTYQVLITVKSTDDKVTKKKFKFSLLRRTTFGTTLNVGPEPASRGDELQVVGTMKRVSWGPEPTYVPYANRTVQVQFKASGTRVFKNVKNATTGADGNIAETVPATKSGTWRLHWAGNAATNAVNSNVDGVTVS